MGWVVNPTPRPLYPWKETWYPFYGRLGWLHVRSGQVRKISSPPGSYRTVQPVASRYTVCAIFISAGTSYTKTKFSEEYYSTSCPLLFYFCVIYKTIIICLSYRRLSTSVWDSVRRKQRSPETKYLYKNMGIWDLKQTFCIVTLP